MAQLRTMILLPQTGEEALLSSTVSAQLSPFSKGLTRRFYRIGWPAASEGGERPETGRVPVESRHDAMDRSTGARRWNARLQPGRTGTPWGQKRPRRTSLCCHPARPDSSGYRRLNRTGLDRGRAESSTGRVSLKAPTGALVAGGRRTYGGGDGIRTRE